MFRIWDFDIVSDFVLRISDLVTAALVLVSFGAVAQAASPELSGISPRGVTLVLLLFGVGLTVGNLGGGRLADWRIMPTVAALFAALAATLALLAVVGASPAAAVATIFAWGAIVFALVAPLQMRVVQEAAGAPNLASIVNQGAFNLGNAGAEE